MTRASEGLRLAAPNMDMKALAGMSADDLIASLSDDQKTALAASLAPAAAAKEPAKKDGEKPDDAKPGEGDDEAGDGNKKPKEGAEASAEVTAARAEGFDAGRKAERDRVAAVMASEHFAGREAQATKLLANPGLSAEEVTSLLADMPDQSGAQMLANMRGRNPDLGAGGDADRGAKGQQAQSVWDSAIAKINPGHKAK